jgi:hypothetical protein
VFVITEMYRVFLGHWRAYVRASRRARPGAFGWRDRRGRALARAIARLERSRGEGFDEARARVVALVSEMQAFMRDHPPPHPPQAP